jgi:N-acetylglucosamine-6-phosphate deacetylase
MRDRPSDTHRRIAQKEAGRKLASSSDVHHKDGNKANNTPGNLDVQPHGAHSAETNKTRSVNKLRKALTMHQRGEKLY